MKRALNYRRHVDLKALFLSRIASRLRAVSRTNGCNCVSVCMSVSLLCIDITKCRLFHLAVNASGVLDV
jgi:hypothetical protein